MTDSLGVRRRGTQRTVLHVNVRFAARITPHTEPTHKRAVNVTGCDATTTCKHRISCTASGNPAPVFTWYRNDTRLRLPDTQYSVDRALGTTAPHTHTL